MRTGRRVRAHNDLEILVLDRALEHRQLERDPLLGLLEALLRVVAGAEVALLVLEVVLRDQADVRLEIRAMLRHERELAVRQLAAVRAGRAARDRRGARRRYRMGADPRSLAGAPRLIARGAYLRIGERLPTAFADALRRENLDDVGASRDHRPYPGADLRRGQLRVGELRDRREDAGPQEVPVPYAVAELHIRRRADALDGSESGSKRDFRVLARRDHAVELRLHLRGKATVVAEMGVDVDVRVDHPRHQRELLQVVGDRSGGRVVAAGYARDARPLDDQCDVLLHATFAIEQARGPDDDVRLGRQNDRCRAEGERERNGAESAA